MPSGQANFVVVANRLPVDRVVGADLVHRWGGRVLLAELSPGHSTTATIRKLAR